MNNGRSKVEGDRVKFSQEMSKFLSPSPLPSKLKSYSYLVEKSKTKKRRENRPLSDQRRHRSLIMSSSNDSKNRNHFYKDQILELRRKQIKLLQSFHKEKEMYMRESRRQCQKISQLEMLIRQQCDPEINKSNVTQLNSSDMTIRMKKGNIQTPRGKLDQYEKKLKNFQDSLEEKARMLKNLNQKRGEGKNFQPLINEYKRSMHDMEKKHKEKVRKSERELLTLKDKYSKSLDKIRLLEEREERNLVLINDSKRRIEEREHREKASKNRWKKTELEYFERIRRLETKREDDIREIVDENESKTREITQERDLEITKLENRNRRLLDRLDRVTKEKYDQYQDLKNEIEKLQNKLNNYEQFEEINVDVMDASKEVSDIRKIILQVLQDQKNTSIDESLELEKENETYRLMSPRSHIGDDDLDDDKSTSSSGSENSDERKNVFRNLALLKKEIQVLKSKIMEVYAKSFGVGNNCSVM